MARNIRTAPRLALCPTRRTAPCFCASTSSRLPCPRLSGKTQMPPPRYKNCWAGKYGEMSTLNNYMFQSFNFRSKSKFRPFYSLVASITAEELGHVELVQQWRCDAGQRAGQRRGRRDGGRYFRRTHMRR